jgi:hypothetical protein
VLVRETFHFAPDDLRRFGMIARNDCGRQVERMKLDDWRVQGCDCGAPAKAPLANAVSDALDSWQRIIGVLRLLGQPLSLGGPSHGVHAGGMGQLSGAHAAGSDVQSDRSPSGFSAWQ